MGELGLTSGKPSLGAQTLCGTGSCQAECAEDLLFHHDVTLTMFQKEAFGSSCAIRELACKKFDLLDSCVFYSC